MVTNPENAIGDPEDLAHRIVGRDEKCRYEQALLGQVGDLEDNRGGDSGGHHVLVHSRLGQDDLDHLAVSPDPAGAVLLPRASVGAGGVGEGSTPLFTPTSAGQHNGRRNRGNDEVTGAEEVSGKATFAHREGQKEKKE